MEKYPKCMSALKWWCDKYRKDGIPWPGVFSIQRNRHLKRFLMEHPPWFRVSSKCCYYAKKKVSERFARERGIGLAITGVRKSEGGVRSIAYGGCYTPKEKGMSVYRPLFWYTNSTKAEYEKRFGITHSRCYTEYGMARTGCAGCPYNRKILEKLETIKKHEPRLYRAVTFVFRDSYEYTGMYREFVKDRR